MGQKETRASQPQLDLDLETGESPLEVVIDHIIDMQMQYYAFLCDADLARALLAAFNRQPERGKAGTNRKASAVRIMRYRDAMLRPSEWFLSPQPLVFSEKTPQNTWEQEDGQQRLMALIEADRIQPGIKVPFVICVDAPLRVNEILDTGKPKSPADFLTMRGEANAPNLSQAVKLLHCLLHVRYDTPDSWRSFSMSPTMTRVLLEEHPGLIQALGEAQRLRSIIRPPVGAVGHYVISREYHDTKAGGVFLAAEFLGGLATGANLSITDPRLRLRNSLVRGSKLHRRRSGQDVLALLIKCFNAWMLRDDSFQPTFTIKERYPKLLTVKEYLEITEESEVMIPQPEPGDVKV